MNALAAAEAGLHSPAPGPGCGRREVQHKHRRRLTQHLEAGVKVYHMYGLTEMSVWQTMTRLETKEMVTRMPILVTGKNILSGMNFSI